MSNVKVVGKDSNDNEIAVFVRRPNARDFKEAKLHANTLVAKSIKSGAFLTRSQAREQLREAGIFGEAQEKKLKELNDKIDVLTEMLKSGKRNGVQLKKSEGRKVALDIIQLRNEQIELLVKVNELDAYTIESLADDEEFDYLFSCCLLDEEGNRVFESVDDYKARAENESIYFLAAQELQNIIYGYKKPEEIAKERIEYQFLSQCGFINDKLQFINKDGHLTDRDGRLVDENGRYLDVNENVEDNANKIGEFLDD